MTDDRDGYPASPTVWESTVDHSELRSPHDRRPFQSVAESVDEHATVSHAHHSVQSASPGDRSNEEFSSANGHKSPTLQYPRRDNAPFAMERRDTISTMNSGTPPTLVEPGFDEHILRALCELDCGVPLLLDRIKQSMVSCKEVSTFFKKRAIIEDEHGKSLQKLSRSTSELYAVNDGKAGSFVLAWQTSMKIHEMMAENRLRFAQRLNEMSDELNNIAKEVDKNRKQTKDLHTRYERALQESEGNTDKIKNRLDFASEELERVLLQKEGESTKDTGVRSAAGGASGKRALGKAVVKGGLLLKGKNPGNIQRQEDDIRSRLSATSDQYRKAVLDTQTMRQEYFNFQLPRILRSLKECADEIDLGTQYHLTRYAFLYESIVLSDGSVLVAQDEGVGLKSVLETIDNRGDFKTFMQNYAYARGGSAPRGPRRDGPSDEGFLPPLPTLAEKLGSSSMGTNGNIAPSIEKGRPTFGLDLAEQMARDNVEVPRIMLKCCQAIEKYGIFSQGVYRVSGMTSKVASLKAKLDRDLDSVDLDLPEWSEDINCVASVLKMWLRDLPDPLLTSALHQSFIDASKVEIDRLRHIRLHERVNELPDPNYSTLKYLLGHLHRISQHSAENSMSNSNLAIVFGPTLFGLQAATNGGVMSDTSYQNLAIETILNHYVDIFVDDND